MEFPVLSQRKTFISLALKRAVAGSGSAYDFLAQRTAGMRVLDFRKILTGVRWALVGGVATRAYMPERSTVDVDILVHTHDAERVRELLSAAGFTLTQQLLIPGASWKAPDGSVVDILERPDEWVTDALADPPVDAQGFPVLSLPFLILMKLQSSRVQDLADISRMLGWADDASIERVRQIVFRYQPDASEDLESLIGLGKLEKGRGEK